MYSIYSAITIAWLTLLLVFFGPTQLEPSLSLFALCALVTTLVGYEIGHWIAVFLGSRIQRKRVAVQSRKMTALRNSDASESKVFLLATPVSSKNQYLICCKNDDGSLEEEAFSNFSFVPMLTGRNG